MGTLMANTSPGAASSGTTAVTSLPSACTTSAAARRGLGHRDVHALEHHAGDGAALAGRPAASPACRRRPSAAHLRTPAAAIHARGGGRSGSGRRDGMRGPAPAADDQLTGEAASSGSCGHAVHIPCRWPTHSPIHQALSWSTTMGAAGGESRKTVR